VLESLKTPFELDGLARQISQASSPGQLEIRTLIDRAQTDGRQHVIIDQIRGFGDRGTRGAAVLWAFLRSSRSLSLARLRELRRAVRDLDGVEMALDDLAELLAQTQMGRDEHGNLQAHGKVVEAMEVRIRDFPQLTEEALNAAAGAVLQLVEQDNSWSDELFRLADAIRSHDPDRVVLGAKMRAAVDDYIAASLVAASSSQQAFRSMWQRAIWLLSDSAPIGRLVGWLHWGARESSKPNKPRSWSSVRLGGWEPPTGVSQDEITKISGLETARTVIRGFIEHVLPSTGDDYNANKLLPWLELFGFDLTGSFLKACSVLSDSPWFAMSADTVAEGALSGEIPPYEQVWAAITKLDDTITAQLAQTREDRRAAWQGELDYAAQLHIQESAEDEAASPSHFAKGYVRARRRGGGYSWIKGHDRPELIMPLWAEVLRHGGENVSEIELEAYFAAAASDDSLVAEGLRVIGERQLNFGRQRLLDAIASGGRASRRAALTGLRQLDGEGRAEQQILAMLPQLGPVDLAHVCPLLFDHELGKRKAVVRDEIQSIVDGDLRPIVELSLVREARGDDEASKRAYRAIPTAVIDDLLADGPRSLGRLLLILGAADGRDIGATASAWLASEDEDDAESALFALKVSSMPQARPLIAGGLSHPHYSVRRMAMDVLTPDATAGERAAILQLADDKSAAVRLALAGQMATHRWVDSVPVLIHLLGDTRDFEGHPEANFREEPKFGVARGAAVALMAFESLPADAVKALVDIAGQGEEFS
jgi:hypothetical protein